MEFSNADRWLLTLKEGDVSFEDIQKTINETTGEGFDYDAKGDKHAIFHMILNDLDTLCQKGEAARAFERVSEAEVSEVYRITPIGAAKAENLLKDQEHRK